MKLVTESSCLLLLGSPKLSRSPSIRKSIRKSNEVKFWLINLSREKIISRMYVDNDKDCKNYFDVFPGYLSDLNENTDNDR